MNFFEFLNNKNFNDWLISERHSSKEGKELEKLLTDDGFTRVGGRKENKWEKEGIMVVGSRQSNIPARQIYNSIVRDWEKNKERIRALQQRRAV
jgi:hypothetical protein